MTLSHLNEVIDFWDQPKLLGAACTYEALVAACAERFDAQAYTGVIGHSFACEIAQSLVGQTRRPIQHLILTAPIRDLPLGFANLADKLGASDSTGRLRELVANRPSQASTPEEVSIFWKVIQDILSQPRFYRKFWAQDEKVKEYETLLSTLPQLDGPMWQAGLTDFLMHRQTPQPASCLRTVMLGEKDCYHSNFNEEKKVWGDRGYTVHTYRNSGHFPHIEEDCLNTLKG